MKFLKIILCLLILTQLGGCVLTKVITVPMRVGGAAVISIVPIVGNEVHDAIDQAAEIVDDVSL